MQWTNANFIKRIVYLTLLTFLFLFYFTHYTNDNQISSQSVSSHDEGDGLEWVPMEHCQCQRRISLTGKSAKERGVDEREDDIVVYYNQTTCSQDAFRRGKGQKIVGFSFYGDINTAYSKKKGYFEGKKWHQTIISLLYSLYIFRNTIRLILR